MAPTLKAAVSALAVLSALGSFAPAQAQQARNLDRVASDVRVYTGELRNNSAVYSVTVPAGTALQIDAVPRAGSNLDPYLHVRDTQTNELLGEDDDSAGSLGARVLIFAEEEKRIEIAVSVAEAAEGNGARGGFELSLRPTDWRPTPPRTIRTDELVSGNLVPQESNIFHFTAKAGELVTATMRPTGSGVDPMLELRRGRSATGELIASDDDSAGNLGARITRVLDRAGDYTLVAKNIGGSEGGFSLGMGSANAGTSLPPAKDIALGVIESGDLSDTNAAGEFARQAVYKLDNAAKAALRSSPGAVTVRFRKLDSDSSFDPYLDIGFETPLGFTTLLSDDDSLGDLDAQVTLDLSTLAGNNGMWLDALRIIGRSVGDSEGGLYTIEVVKIGSR